MTTTSTQQCDQQPCNIPTEDLTAGTCYSFTVYTRGSNGNSTTGIHTTGCTQPNPPGYVSVNAQPTYAVTLDTTSPATGGVDYYNVTFTDSDGKTETRRTPTNDTLYIVDGLTPGYIYTFKVVSVYNSLASIPYQSVPASTVPSSTTDVTVSDRTTTTVALAVTPGPGGYDGYRVQIVGGGIQRNDTFSHNTTGDRLVVSGLTPGTTFTFTVFTLANGLESEHFHRTQDSTIPSSPSDVTVTDRTTTSVTLTVAPGPGGYDGYRVQKVGGGINRSDTFPHHTSTGPLLVSGLTPGTTFTFTVFTQANGWESEHFYRTQDSTSDKVKRSTVNQAANETTEGKRQLNQS
ncbi:Receptor-type tyrosine-protein phosphatase H [Mizuhopecten yessoensis]|uniref:Receptor-type tyrosine-protein phosphatase H n=1 Tax=Mizuhopecten yessoensis TaxID=6573 RepID=A0A210PY05_MIZYE|nr:Receptor-type tyrosine-protein phosphatase H [Mizuhopecten yessoensis]